MTLIRHIITPILVVVSLFSNVAGATQWEDYSKFMDRFYFLDKQNINEITCHVEVPLISEVLSQVKTQLNQNELNLKFVDDLPAFSVIYDNKEVNFKKPSLDIIIMSDKDIADRDRVEKGISTIKAGFNMQIDGVTTVLTGLFQTYTSPNEPIYNFIEMSISGDAAKFVYKKKDMLFTDIYTANEYHSTMTSHDGTVVAKVSYERKYDKLIVKNTEIAINLGDMLHSVSYLTIEYADIGKILLPVKIIARTQSITKGQETKGQFDILLTDCKVK